MAERVNVGDKVTWMGFKAKVLGTAPGLIGVVSIELETTGEVKQVNVRSLVAVVPPVKPEVAGLLKGMQTIMASWGAQARQDMAAILRALRGPDNNNVEVKRRTTEKIREAAFGGNVGGSFGNVSTGTVTVADIAYARTQSGEHFALSAERAARALGIFQG